MPEPNFERFRTAILGGEPDRVPLGELKVEDQVKEAFLGKSLGSLQEDPKHYLKTDVEFSVEAGYDYTRVPVYLSYPKPQTAGSHTYSVYSEQASQRAWAESHAGLITNDAQFEAYPFPTAGDADYRPIELASNLLPDGMEMITSLKGGGIFERVWMLMGFEAFSFALVENPDLVARMFQWAGSLYYETMERALQYPYMKGILIGDDLAYTEGLMISPDIYRQHLFPWYRRLGELCRSKDVLFIFHSDGQLWEILEDLIDCGIHALHPIEPKAMDIREVKERAAGRISLIGNIDLGYTLTRGTPAEVETEVKQRINDIAPGGGYCLGSSNSVTEYVPLENYRAMIEACFKYGKYPIDPNL